MTASSGVARRHRPDESMSLLVDIATQALDPSYAEVASRRGPDGAAARTRARALLATAGVLAATLIIVVAAVQAHERAPLAERSRQSLLSEVQQETAATAALQRQVDLLRDRTQLIRSRALASSGAGEVLAGRLATAELVAGTVDATGPGLHVVIDDGPGGSNGSNQVLDRDLQSLVNALWASGAEAVAVDDQRLTAQSAIRQAGSAILVNFQPVSRPYVLTAIGNPVTMETSFAASRAVAQMRTYVQLYGLRFDYNRVSHVTLPRAPGLALTYARPAGRGAEERR